MQSVSFYTCGFNELYDAWCFCSCFIGGGGSCALLHFLILFFFLLLALCYVTLVSQTKHLLILRICHSITESLVLCLFPFCSHDQDKVKIFFKDSHDREVAARTEQWHNNPIDNKERSLEWVSKMTLRLGPKLRHNMIRTNTHLIKLKQNLNVFTWYLINNVHHHWLHLRNSHLQWAKIQKGLNFTSERWFCLPRCTSHYYGSSSWFFFKGKPLFE